MSLLDILLSGQVPGGPAQPVRDPWSELEEIKKKQGQLRADEAPPETVKTEGGWETTADPSPVSAPKRSAGMVPPNPLSQMLGGFAANADGLIPDLIRGGQTPDRENQTVRVLMDRLNIGQDEATVIARNPAVMQKILTEKFGGGKKQYGLNAVPFTDPEGNTVLGQLHSGGGVEMLKLPPGLKPAAGHDKIDLVTHWLIKDKKTGAVIGMVPKDIEGRARAEKVGQAQGVAQVDLPRVESNAKAMIEKIEALEKNPNLDSVIGGIQGHMKGWMLTEGQADAAGRIDELQGGTFLQAFESLKGGGQISEKEGEKATDALNRLKTRGTSEAAYRQALADFKSEVKRLTALARTRAAGAGKSGAGAQEERKIIDGKSYVKRGGNWFEE
jgi:hypothetical protein